MRHYMLYDHGGTLIGCDTRSGGWPHGADPRDPNTEDKPTQALREFHATNTPELAGWFPYDCPCSRSVLACQCSYMMVPTHYYNGAVLFPKPVLTIEVNGFVIDTGVVNAAPGSIATIGLFAAVPDNHTVEIKNSSGSDLLASSRVLMFTAGTSTTVDVTVPPQGVSKSIEWRSKFICGARIAIRGWA